MRIFILLLALMLTPASGAAQDQKTQEQDCKVLTPRLQGNYQGECKDGLAHGHGTARGQDTYTGQFAEGKPEGMGSYVRAEGMVFQGRFEDGMLNGKGVFRQPGDGGMEVYKGDFKDGGRQGNGTYFWPDGSWLRGEWVDGKPHGVGSIIFPNGAWYHGEWVDGQKEGLGRFQASNNSTYIGYWENDKRNGMGMLQFGNGESYQGEWANGKWHGRGIYFWPDGRIYEGQWEQGARNGWGREVGEEQGLMLAQEGYWENNLVNDNKTQELRDSGFTYEYTVDVNATKPNIPPLNIKTTPEQAYMLQYNPLSEAPPSKK